jgi:hypothetical protein
MNDLLMISMLVQTIILALDAVGASPLALELRATA